MFLLIFIEAGRRVMLHRGGVPIFVINTEPIFNVLSYYLSGGMFFFAILVILAPAGIVKLLQRWSNRT